MNPLVWVLLLAMLVSPSACAEPGAGLAVPGATQEAVMSPALFAAAVDYLARDVRGAVRVDPRPLRIGADLRSIGEDDLDPDAAGVTQLRSQVLTERQITLTDAMVDQRCTFSAGVGLPPGREAMLADSTRHRMAECAAREAYTTFILTLPEPVPPGEYPPGTWRVSAHVMDKGGFSIWDLYLHARSGLWEVMESQQRFVIWS